MSDYLRAIKVIIVLIVMVLASLFLLPSFHAFAQNQQVVFCVDSATLLWRGGIEHHNKNCENVCLKQFGSQQINDLLNGWHITSSTHKEITIRMNATNECVCEGTEYIVESKTQ